MHAGEGRKGTDRSRWCGGYCICICVCLRHGATLSDVMSTFLPLACHSQRDGESKGYGVTAKAGTAAVLQLYAGSWTAPEEGRASSMLPRCNHTTSMCRHVRVSSVCARWSGLSVILASVPCRLETVHTHVAKMAIGDGPLESRPYRYTHSK